MRSPSVVQQERRAALQQFEVSRSEPIDVGPGHGAAREARMELDRREAVRQRERAALLARAAVQQESPEPGPERPRAVVVHRAPWMREALRRELERAGVEVVELHEDGAAGLGSVVAEQPDLVVVQEQLPWKDGLEVVREVRRFAPSARIAVHLDRPAGQQGAREAGADAVFARSTRPADMVGQLVSLVAV